MEQKWIRADRLSTKYEKGVVEFIKFVVERADNPNRINCLCIRCDYLNKVIIIALRDHLFINGIDISYTRWIWHYESARKERAINSGDRKCDEREEVDCDDDDKLEDMMWLSSDLHTENIEFQEYRTEL